MFSKWQSSECESGAILPHCLVCANFFVKLQAYSGNEYRNLCIYRCTDDLKRSALWCSNRQRSGEVNESIQSNKHRSCPVLVFNWLCVPFPNHAHHWWPEPRNSILLHGGLCQHEAVLQQLAVVGNVYSVALIVITLQLKYCYASNWEMWRLCCCRLQLTEVKRSWVGQWF